MPPFRFYIFRPDGVTDKMVLEKARRVIAE